jgi:hypothetical protein
MLHSTRFLFFSLLEKIKNEQQHKIVTLLLESRLKMALTSFVKGMVASAIFLASNLKFI